MKKTNSGKKSPSSRKARDLRPVIRIGRPRKWVQARLPDGRIFETRPGASLADIFAIAFAHSRGPVMAAIVNGNLCELTAALKEDSDVVPLTLSHPEGVRIYRRSLSFLLLTACAEIYPDAQIFIEQSATTAGAYFCELGGRNPFSREDLSAIENRMREIVEEDVPITSTQAPLQEAVELFRRRGEDDKARLLISRKIGTVILYGLRNRRDYFQGLMAPSTGCLKYFALHPYSTGFMLQFPHQRRPVELSPIAPYPKLFTVFEEAGQWLDRLGIRSAGALNEAIAAGRLPEISLVAEALHEARIAEIAADINSLRRRIKFILIAGPSSSGKTTFSRRLAVQLLANGLRPFPISLDDYFFSRDKTPRDSKGELNYETLQALDLDLFREQLSKLGKGRKVQMPRYEFATGERVPGAIVKLASDDLLIIEGIHGLNPELIEGLPHESFYRVYVSALTQLNLDRHNRINTTDCRLIRRIVRDAAKRGYNATQTLQRWDSVVAGEKQNIFPFQENSDAIFNSALVHELSLLRPLADPLLLQVRHDSPQYLEAVRILELLQWFYEAPSDFVPSNSILREFIGKSMLETFSLWPKS
jgi:uridine kinase